MDEDSRPDLACQTFFDVDPGKEVGYPNGRLLANDIADHHLALSTGGRIASDHAAAHPDTSDQFSYRAAPHRAT